ncbi:MAG: ABATE domain-containing protein [Actinomycetota bacterium]
MEALDLANWREPSTEWPLATVLPDRETLEELTEARGTVRRLLAASLASAPFGAADVEAVNAWAAGVPQYPELDPDGGRVVVGRRLSPLAVALAGVARSAIEILGTDLRERLAVCRAPGCGRYHLRGRAGQVWCSAACGNRARVARHYRRSRI